VITFELSELKSASISLLFLPNTDGLQQIEDYVSFYFEKNNCK